MIRLMALAILTLANLTSLNLDPSFTTRLERKVVPPVGTERFLITPTKHTAMIQPVRTGSSDLALGAAAVLALDAGSNTVLYQKNSGQQLPIASITKLATALVILQRHELSQVITIPALPAYGPADELLGLKPGQQFTVGDLLKATLIGSANDAADALAIADSGTKTAFSARMNRLIGSWGLERTRFSNPSGLEDVNNYSTASDLAKLAKLALTNQTVRQLVSQGEASIADTAGTNLTFKSTNKLLADSRFRGLKTGYTLASGQSFLGLANINGHEVITVVLNSPNRFGETSRLADWIQKEFIWL